MNGPRCAVYGLRVRGIRFKVYGIRETAFGLRYTVRHWERILGDFQQLKVWKRAKDLAVNIYRITNDGAFCKDYGLRDQIRRAVVSIPSNIAEGDELGTNKQAINFFYIAKGSTAEVLTQAIIAKEIGYITEKTPPTE